MDLIYYLKEQEIINNTLRTCKKCGEEKKLSEFCKIKRVTALPFTFVCKRCECMRTKERNYRLGKSLPANVKYSKFNEYGFKKCPSCLIFKSKENYPKSGHGRCFKCSAKKNKNNDPIKIPHYQRTGYLMELLKEGNLHCCRCDLVLGKDNFRKSTKNKSGYTSSCKKCLYLLSKLHKVNKKNQVEKRRIRSLKKIILLSKDYIASVLRIKTSELTDKMYEEKKSQILEFRRRKQEKRLRAIGYTDDEIRKYQST
jgi:hypothetical protein